MLHEIAAGLDACLLAHRALREEREARWRRQQDGAARPREAGDARDAKRTKFRSELIAGDDDARRLKAWLTQAAPAHAANQPLAQSHCLSAPTARSTSRSSQPRDCDRGCSADKIWRSFRRLSKPMLTLPDASVIEAGRSLSV